MPDNLVLNTNLFYISKRDAEHAHCSVNEAQTGGTCRHAPRLRKDLTDKRHVHIWERVYRTALICNNDVAEHRSLRFDV